MQIKPNLVKCGEIPEGEKIVNWELINKIEARMVEIDLILEAITKMESRTNLYYEGNTKVREREV